MWTNMSSKLWKFMLLELSTLIFFQVKIKMFIVHLPESISESWLWMGLSGRALGYSIRGPILQGRIIFSVVY